jgi:hypothetical protein
MFLRVIIVHSRKRAAFHCNESGFFSKAGMLFSCKNETSAMTKEEARDFIAKHYNTYINKLVRFNKTGVTALVKAIDVLEADGGEYIATCFLEDPNNGDPAFKNHILSHMDLQEVIDTGVVVPA